MRYLEHEVISYVLSDTCQAVFRRAECQGYGEEWGGWPVLPPLVNPVESILLPAREAVRGEASDQTRSKGAWWGFTRKLRRGF